MCFSAPDCQRSVDTWCWTKLSFLGFLSCDALELPHLVHLNSPFSWINQGTVTNHSAFTSCGLYKLYAYYFAIFFSPLSLSWFCFQFIIKKFISMYTSKNDKCCVTNSRERYTYDILYQNEPYGKAKILSTLHAVCRCGMQFVWFHPISVSLSKDFHANNMTNQSKLHFCTTYPQQTSSNNILRHARQSQ